MAKQEGEIKQATEILKDKLYFVCLRYQPRCTPGVHLFTVDNIFTYEPFFADFGPLNLANVYHFCKLLDKKFQDVRLARKKFYLYTSYDACKRTNAAFLLGAYLVVRFSMTGDEAYEPFRSIDNFFLPFRDASVGIATHNLYLRDCFNAIYKAKSCGIWDETQFDVNEYEFYEKVENGDLNWIIPNKFIAFSGPTATRTEDPNGARTFMPDDYIPLFKKYGVSAIVRLNKKEYDRSIFVQSGINHYDLYFTDGTAPSEEILLSFLDIAENEPGVVCVHCKAGLGRTGTLLAGYLIKHYKFTANEAIAWMRIVRPGSVIGPQQHFLQEYQALLWRQGDLYKKKRPQTSPSAPAQNATLNNNEVISNRSVIPASPKLPDERPTQTTSSYYPQLSQSLPSHSYSLRERSSYQFQMSSKPYPARTAKVSLKRPQGSIPPLKLATPQPNFTQSVNKSARSLSVTTTSRKLSANSTTSADRYSLKMKEESISFVLSPLNSPQPSVTERKPK